MTPFRLSLAHFRRNWFRSLLTVLSVTVAIVLFCVLRSVITSLEGVVGGASSNRLITQSAVSLFVQLPISMWRKVQSVPGVRSTTHWTWFGGLYKDEREFFARFGVDVPSLRLTYGDKTGGAVSDVSAGGRKGLEDLVLSSEQWDAFEKNRRACIVGPELVKRYGWKIGDRIPLIGNIFPGDYELEIAGVYQPGSTSIDTATLFFHWDYMNETAGRPGRVSTYTLVLDDPDRAAEVADRVDQLFMNSPTRTRTFSEREFQAQFVQMWGNVPLLLNGISIAVFFACFMITVNTMLLLARERFREIGILKAIGFRDGSLAALSVFEALLLCVLGAGLGVLVALGLCSAIAPGITSFLPGFAVEPETAATACGLGLALGLLSGIAPALFVRRLAVIDTLRRVA